MIKEDTDAMWLHMSRALEKGWLRAISHLPDLLKKQDDRKGHICDEGGAAWYQ